MSRRINAFLPARDFPFVRGICAGIISVIVVSGGVALSALWEQPHAQGVVMGSANTSAEGEQKQGGGLVSGFQVSSQTVGRQLQISATVEPTRTIAIFAPFDGAISQTFIKMGDIVEAGQSLIAMDTRRLEEQYRDAQAAYIKAKITADKLKAWDTSVEMQKAKRAVETARSMLAKIDRDVEETKRLLDQGIVSRNEYENKVLEQRNQRASVASAEDELESIKKQGGEENLNLALLDLETATSRLSVVEEDRKRSTILSPIAGIVINAPGKEKDVSKEIEAGMNLKKDEAVFVIADVSGFTSVGEVDEIDVDSIHVGQVVSIESDAFPGKKFVGKISNISAESVRSNASLAAKFRVRAEFTVDDPDFRKRIRIGMSSRIEVSVYESADSIVIPIDYVLGADSNPRVLVRKNGQDVETPVILGETHPQGVEIKSGLNSGDEIVLPQNPKNSKGSK